MRASGTHQLGLAWIGDASAPYPPFYSSGYENGPVAPVFLPIDGSFPFFFYPVPRGAGVSHF